MLGLRSGIWSMGMGSGLDGLLRFLFDHVVNDFLFQ